ncbi:MAG: ABC transporter ATP-binding protein [Lachnospiraceae bacterium]|nr:ABC transporter ATP-binding protein [Lachnospiraceae bacterium]
MAYRELIMRANDITRSFPLAGGGKIQVLKGISVEIPKKSITLLRGRSGSGKTTLINILSALDYPTEGKVFFKDQDITKMSESAREALRRKEIGIIFQSVSLIPIMTAYENVEFALRLAGYEGDRKERAEKALKMVGLGARMHHMPQELSGGEQQRVAIARAMAHKPKLIFADEPTAELDSGTARHVMKIFKDLVQEEDITIVMTTHDISLMDAADRTYVMEDGEVVSNG